MAVDKSVILGLDPGANLGLAVARRKQPGEGHHFGYFLMHHSTTKTPSEHNVAERLEEYRQAVVAACLEYRPDAAYVEVPWRKARGKNALSVYTHSGKNVGSLALLCAITGGVLATLHSCGVPVYEVPSPIGKRSKEWEAQKEYEAKGVYGVELRKHEAVSAMLALKGL